MMPDALLVVPEAQLVEMMLAILEYIRVAVTMRSLSAFSFSKLFMIKAVIKGIFF